MNLRVEEDRVKWKRPGTISQLLEYIYGGGIFNFIVGVVGFEKSSLKSSALQMIDSSTLNGDCNFSC